MALVKSLVSLVNVLETYRGRDRFIRWITYAGMYMGGDGKTPAQVKWRTLSAEMGACRVILRLFDDLPMFLFNLSKGFGFKEKGIMQILEVLSSLLNQAFYPSEHIAWLRQKKILDGLPTPMLLVGLFIWAVSLLVEIIKGLLKLRGLAMLALKLKKQRQLDKDGSGQGSSQNAEIKDNLKKLASERRDVLLLLAHSCCDLVNAVSWMPPGILWSQKLSPATNGVFGLIATTIMLYRNWPTTAPTV
ncbi:peroxisomal membrane protein 11C [Aplysia californica]|uniref:Peroxisomal membrane protein 11C n=1 Tax=Aplysia californica TaxID=6500 RepID=A0ABM0K679_APLCA|nr:peroxisomal membrane protein 11C [Aplysia californica]